MKVVAQRGVDVFAVTPAAALADTRQARLFTRSSGSLSQEMPLQSILATGYWKPVDPDVVDAVIDWGDLRREIHLRLLRAEGKDRHFSDRRHGVPPV